MAGVRAARLFAAVAGREACSAAGAGTSDGAGMSDEVVGSGGAAAGELTRWLARDAEEEGEGEGARAAGGGESSRSSDGRRCEADGHSASTSASGLAALDGVPTALEPRARHTRCAPLAPPLTPPLRLAKLAPPLVQPLAHST